MFITFEGLDFCGKSTQVKLLSEHFKKLGSKVEIIREPGGTIISEEIRGLLLDPKYSEMEMETELLLFSASRVQLVKERIIPYLKKNTIVISDRFHDSSIAYQGYGRGVDLEFLIHLQMFAIQGAIPDITFFIDIPIEEVLLRKGKLKKEEIDRIESAETDFYKKVRSGYLEMIKKEDRFRYIDGTESIEQIQNKIVKEIETLKFEKPEYRNE